MELPLAVMRRSVLPRMTSTMMRTRAEGLTNPQVQQLWKFIRAWNASRDEQEMDRINMTTRALTNDNFPDMR